MEGEGRRTELTNDQVSDLLSFKLKCIGAPGSKIPFAQTVYVKYGDTGIVGDHVYHSHNLIISKKLMGNVS